MDSYTSLEMGPAHSLTVGEGFFNPIGFHDPIPSFSWKLGEGVKHQTAYRIELDAEDVHWDSGWVESAQSSLVPYTGEPFTSRERVYWHVRFRDQDGKESDWSKPASFELGLLDNKDWHAKWINPVTDSDPKQEPVAWLRRAFKSDGHIAKARLYVTARGLFELEFNGQRVGNDHFANGWTSYHNRLDTLTYDVTDQVKDGDNSIVAMLGKGWYAGRMGWKDQYGCYGTDPALLLQLEITNNDGTAMTVCSDEAWEATRQGPVLSSSIYNGERYDARVPIEGWQPVKTDTDLGSASLTPKAFAPVRHTQTLEVRSVTEPSPCRFVFDLGQNMVGWAQIKAPVEKDRTLTIRFAEMLQDDGNIYTENLRSARSTDTYTAAESGMIDWQPHFTYHGFRYVELSGLPEAAQPKSGWVTGVLLHSDLKPIGYFTSSHDKLNQLQSNIVWGQRGNFVDIPTDCPQRDERLGWTGDAQVFCPTAMFNYDCHAYFKSWLGSMRDDQLPDGRIPHVVPDVLNGGAGSPGWMDAATIIPWAAYVRTGDKAFLADNIVMMERLVGYYRSQAREDHLIPKIEAFGDWLQPYADNIRGDTPAPLLATAFYAHSTQILADSLRVLGHNDEAESYAEEATAIKSAFVNQYFDITGKLQNAPETQTAYVLALTFDLIGDGLKPKAAEHLVRLVHDADDHLRTGFLGTPYIVSELDKAGYPELACKVLLKNTYPSWFFSINQGATTMWERWNSYSHAAGFGDAGMNSFNHYAYGAIGQFLYERVAGLEPDPEHPGYKHFFVCPLTRIPLDHAKVELETPYGRAASAWKKKGDKVTLHVTVPPNTTATIIPSAGRIPQTVCAGEHQYEFTIKQPT